MHALPEYPHISLQPNVDVVMGIVAKYADIQEEHALYNELITYFSHIDTTTQEERVLHLADMVKPELIRLHLDADNWEEAVRKAYEPMVQMCIRDRSWTRHCEMEKQKKQRNCRRTSMYCAAY